MSAAADAVPDSLGGKVLDSTALLAWASGSLAMATWRSLAVETQSTLLVPALASDEAKLVRPDATDLIDVLLGSPVTLVQSSMSQTDRLATLDRYSNEAAFDPLAVWVTRLCRDRGWPALTGDSDRLHRADPDIETDPA